MSWGQGGYMGWCPQPASLLVWLLLIYPSNGKAEDKSAKNIRRQNFGSLSPSSRQNISYLSVWNIWPQLYRENVKFKALASGPLELWWQTIAGLAVHDPAGNQSIAYLVTHTGPLALPRPQQWSVLFQNLILRKHPYFIGFFCYAFSWNCIS